MAVFLNDNNKQFFIPSNAEQQAMTHLEERLEQDLNKIHDRVAKMGAQVQEAVKDAVHALQTGNTKLAYATVLNDNPINRSMREIDRICHSFFAIHMITSYPYDLYSLYTTLTLFNVETIYVL